MLIEEMNLLQFAFSVVFFRSADSWCLSVKTLVRITTESMYLGYVSLSVCVSVRLPVLCCVM